MREGVLESLLINHPLDCPICDQAGECKLQEYSVELRSEREPLRRSKSSQAEAVDLGPRSCSMRSAVFFARAAFVSRADIAGDDALGIINRGSYNTIATFPGMPFDNNYTLNTVDVCPVGALTSKDFRFQMRAWFLKETKSVCTSCATGCNVLIGFARRKNLSLHAARQRCGQRFVVVRCRPFELQMDRSRRSFERRFGARTKIHLDGGAQRNFRQAKESSGGLGGNHRFGSPDERRALADFQIESQVGRNQ